MPQPDHRARAAACARELQRWYVRRTGVWKSTGWWNAANALSAVIRYTRHTGDTEHAWVVEHTFSRARRRHHDFANRYFDDNGWWGLAWVDAYDLTGENRYLDAARVLFDRNVTGWDDHCGGGLWWNTDRTYKNAITNELFIALAALLHQRTPGDTEYLDWARRDWEWLLARGLIGPGGLVNDGLTGTCANNGGTTWTYNQGVILLGLAVLADATGDPAYLRRAEGIADAALGALTSGRGILTEPCESGGPGRCDGDQTQFKGIFARCLHELWLRDGHPAYRGFLLANAGSAWEHARNDAGQFGLRWAGPFDAADASRQTSALEVITAAAALTSAHGQHGLPSGASSGA